jgi:hypothetical protein
MKILNDIAMQLFWDWIKIWLMKNGPQIGAEGVWLTMIYLFISFY